MTRMNIQFNDRQRQSIREMAAYLGRSQAGVLQVALALLKIVVREQKLGNTIAVVKDGQVLREIVGIFDETSAATTESKGDGHVV